MSNHTDGSEKTAKTPLKTASYYFICACGCGQVSDELGKEYIRLRQGQKWYNKDCAKGKEAVKEFKGGMIINESDF